MRGIWWASSCLVFSLQLTKFLQVGWVQILSKCPSYIVSKRAHKGNSFASCTAYQQLKFSVCLQSELNGICTQTKFQVTYEPNKLEYSTDQHITYLTHIHKMYLSVNTKLKPCMIFSAAVHFDCPRFLSAFQRMIDGWRWEEDRGWHNIFHAGPQPKSIQWEPRWYIQTDGWTWQK